MRSAGLLISLGLALAAQTALAGRILRAEPLGDTASQYTRVDFNIVVDAQFKNPFSAKEVSVDVVFTAPSGKQLRLPAFCVDAKALAESRWEARFAPTEAGSYGYQVELREGGRLQAPSVPGHLSVRPSPAKGFLRAYSDWAFRFDNGELFRGIGENFGWEHRDEDDSKYFRALHENPRFNYEAMLSKLSGQGANIIRTWMIYWNLPVDWQWVSNASRYQSSQARFNESGIARMDALVGAAERQGIYIMLTLDPHVALLGEGWEHSAYNKKNGGFAASPAEFFSSPESQAQYKDKLRFIVARWGYSTSIAAWEFFNEVDNVTYADNDHRIPDEPVVKWHQEMSRYLAAVDPFGHMITTSISHRDLAGLNDIPEIAFNQKHIYKHTEAIPETIAQYTGRHRKPYVIGEYGFEWDWSKNFGEFADDMIYDFKRGLWYGLFSATPVAPLSWWWEFFDEKGTTSYFQSLRDIDTLMLRAGQGRFELVAASAGNPKVEARAVQAGSRVFVYLNNRDATPQRAQVTVAGSSPAAPTQVYDPETRRFRPLATAEVPLRGREQLILIAPQPATAAARP